MWFNINYVYIGFWLGLNFGQMYKHIKTGDNDWDIVYHMKTVYDNKKNTYL